MVGLSFIDKFHGLKEVTQQKSNWVSVCLPSLYGKGYVLF